MRCAWSLPYKNVKVKQIPTYNDMVSVCGAIELNSQKIIYIQKKNQYLKTEDIIETIDKIRAFNKHKKVCVFLDNAKTHSS